MSNEANRNVRPPRRGTSERLRWELDQAGEEICNFVWNREFPLARPEGELTSEVVAAQARRLGRVRIILDDYFSGHHE